jgi:hypothetical protein
LMAFCVGYDISLPGAVLKVGPHDLFGFLDHSISVPRV